MGDEYRWPEGRAAQLRDGLTSRDIVDALYAPASLRLDNRTPADAPTFMAVCAPTGEQRLIVVAFIRADTDAPWTIVAARDARPNERMMWRKHTS